METQDKQNKQSKKQSCLVDETLGSEMTDTKYFIYVPAINLYVAKESHLSQSTWEESWDYLECASKQMPTINEFREFLKHLMSQPDNEEYQTIFKRITSSYGAEWLDASFIKENGTLYLLTENNKRKTGLERCLMEDQENPRINLIDWVLNNHTNQGLPIENVNSGNLSYIKPGENNRSIAVWSAYSDYSGGNGARLDCHTIPNYSCNHIGVRQCYRPNGGRK